MDEEFVKALYRQELKFALSPIDEASILARGESALSVMGVPSQYGRFVVEGAPIKAIDMKDGVALVTSPTMVALAGPHPNAAKLFANWSFSQEGQEVYTRAASITPIRKDVHNSAPEASQLTPQRPVAEIYDDVNRAAQLVSEQWLNKLWGRTR